MAEAISEAEAKQYFAEQRSRDADFFFELLASRRRAWQVALVACLIGLAGIGDATYVNTRPLPQPPVIEVDKSTGMAWYLTTLGTQKITPAWAEAAFDLNRYVIARESYSWTGVAGDYYLVGLMSADDVAQTYGEEARARTKKLSDRATIHVDVKNILSGQDGTDTANVWFSTTLQYQNLPPEAPVCWMARVAYKYTGAPMSVKDRRLNPRGFEATYYDLQPQAGKCS